MNKQAAFDQWNRAEESARHGLFTFLILFTLVGMDIMSRKTQAEQERATQTWVAWGVTFVLLAFFIITPEQELLQSMRTSSRSIVSHLKPR